MAKNKASILFVVVTWCANLGRFNPNLVDVQTMFASICHLVLCKTTYFMLSPKVLRRKFIHGPTGGWQSTMYTPNLFIVLGALVA